MHLVQTYVSTFVNDFGLDKHKVAEDYEFNFRKLRRLPDLGFFRPFVMY